MDAVNRSQLKRKAHNFGKRVAGKALEMLYRFNDSANRINLLGVMDAVNRSQLKKTANNLDNVQHRKVFIQMLYRINDSANRTNLLGSMDTVSRSQLKRKANSLASVQLRKRLYRCYKGVATVQIEQTYQETWML